MNKHIAYADLAQHISRYKKEKKIIVLVTGVFDLFHQAHFEFLKRAKAAGDVLLVGIESDERVKELKGPNRPKDSAQIRLMKVGNHPDVDGVFILPSDFNHQAAYRDLLERIRPDILAVSSHTPFIENKQKLMEQIGGKVSVVMEQDKRISTTQLIKNNHS